jgi:predicted ATPase
MRLPEAAVADVGLRGGQAARALANDWIRHGAKVLERVGDFYRDHLGGWLLDLERDGQSFSVVLRHPRDRTVAVNLQDAGVGLSQVLPVVVQRELDRAAGRAGGLDIIEQPELHLHPGVHGDLADLYIEAIRTGSTRFLIETHSENFVLRLRRRIAERKLDPGAVALYWVNDDPAASPRVRPIAIDRSGQLDFWPRGVFAEDLDEVRAIRSAQREHTP